MWQIRPGHEHNFIDGRTHVHQVHLFNSVTGGELNVSLLLGVDTCRECGRPYAKSDLAHLDPQAEIQKIVPVLKANHEAVMAYMKKHNIPVRIGPLGGVAPEGHRVALVGDQRFLHLIRGAK